MTATTAAPTTNRVDRCDIPSGFPLDPAENLNAALAEAIELRLRSGDCTFGLLSLPFGGTDELLGLAQGCLGLRKLGTEGALSLLALGRLALGTNVLGGCRPFSLAGLARRRRRREGAEAGRFLLLE